MPLVVLIGGIVGGLTGYLMQYWMSAVDYPINVGGKPHHSWPAFIVITFEMTILFAGISAVFGMLALNGLPMPYHPVFNVPRFALASKDRFFLIVFSSDKKYDPSGTRKFLEGLDPRSDFGGAQLNAAPPQIRSRKLTVRRSPALARSDSWVPHSCAFFAQEWDSTDADGISFSQERKHFAPRNHINHVDASLRLPPRHASAAARESASRKSDFFPDQRSARPPVEGTVARGQLHEDSYFYTGKIGNNPGDSMPFPVTKEVLRTRPRALQHFLRTLPLPCGRRQRLRALARVCQQPPSFHIARLQKAPVGYFYDVITEGFGIMPDYASQIPPHDRWNIVAYVRALQLSQNATMADVPAGQNIPSEPPKFGRAGHWREFAGCTARKFEARELRNQRKRNERGASEPIST